MCEAALLAEFLCSRSSLLLLPRIGGSYAVLVSSGPGYELRLATELKVGLSTLGPVQHVQSDYPASYAVAQPKSLTNGFFHFHGERPVKR